MYRPTASAIFLLLLVVSSVAFAQPSISRIEPSAVRVGETTEVTIHGAKLDDPLQIWTSFPAKVELLPGEPDKKDQASRKCRITLTDLPPVGIEGIAVSSPAGTSDILLMMRDDLPNATDNGANHAISSAQKVEIPAAIDGTANGNQFDHYSFAVSKGQAITVEAVAARLGSPMDPVLRLLKKDGTELLLIDDDASFGADCRFRHEFSEGGEFILQIYDNQYRSGGRYRLRVGDFPLVTVPYPLGGRRGSTARFGFAGATAGEAAPVFIRLPDEDTGGQLTIAARFPDGKVSGFATLATSDLPERLEVEPNDETKAATEITLPAAVNGMLQQHEDKDYYVFPATQGEAFAFQAVTRRLGSPSMLFMRLFDANGKQLAETAVNDSDEFSIAHTFPADGMYYLMVEDLLRRGGPEHGYRVEVKPNAGFSLNLKNDKDTNSKFRAPQNQGTVPLVMQIGRRSYDGPIRLVFEPQDCGLRLLKDTIPAKAKEFRAIIAVDPDTAPGTLVGVRLVGIADVNGKEIRETLRTNAVVKKKWAQLAYPPAWIDGLLHVATAAPLDAFYDVKPAAESIVLNRESNSAEVAVKLERIHKDFKGNPTLEVRHLPDGFTYAVSGEKEDYKITLNGPPEASMGMRMIELVAHAELNGNGLILNKPIRLEVPERPATPKAASAEAPAKAAVTAN